MNKKVMAEFVKITSELKALEEKREALRESIVQEMDREKLTKVESDYGVFSIAQRVSYEYTDAIKKLKEKVKLAELKEQKTGKATERITQYLYFKATDAN